MPLPQSGVLGWQVDEQPSPVDGVAVVALLARRLDDAVAARGSSWQCRGAAVAASMVLPSSHCSRRSVDDAVAAAGSIVHVAEQPSPAWCCRRRTARRRLASRRRRTSSVWQVAEQPSLSDGVAVVALLAASARRRRRSVSSLHVRRAAVAASRCCRRRTARRRRRGRRRSRRDLDRAAWTSSRRRWPCCRRRTARSPVCWMPSPQRLELAGRAAAVAGRPVAVVALLAAAA